MSSILLEEDILWNDNATWEDTDIWNDTLPKNTSHSIRLLSGTYIPNEADLQIAFYNLLPQGEAWAPIHEDTELKKLMYGIAVSLLDFRSTLIQTMQEYYPGNVGMFVTDWEQLLQLPKCIDLETQTLQERLNTIKAMLSISPYSNEEFFVYICSVFGQTITIAPHDPLDPFTIHINIDSVEVIYFRAGLSVAGDPLQQNSVDAITECILNFFKHVHTNLVFTSS